MVPTIEDKIMPVMVDPTLLCVNSLWEDRLSLERHFHDIFHLSVICFK